MVEVKWDLSPLFGPQLVRFDPARLENLRDPRLVDAVMELVGLSPRQHQLRHRPTEHLETTATRRVSLLQPDNTLYLAWKYDQETDTSYLLGFLKVGRKQLFLFDKNLQPYEGSFVCLLDFYVHYSHQRKGIGSRLFQFMMDSERVQEAYQIALDNPTVTLLGFFAKKFGLADPVWQNTNFVVFPQLFSASRKDERNAPEGWGPRPSTPRHICLGASSSNEAGMNGIEGKKTLADRSSGARSLLLRNLSSKPLW